MRHRWGAVVVAVTGAIWVAAPAWAQYPTQYPPGQYPQTYPPNTYPPGSYPPITYPPNNIPVNLPTPRFPGKGPKEPKSSDDAKLTVVSADGTLRKLGEKDLVLGARKGLLRFRLLAKTKFLDKDGNPFRDSLLHPGDQLSVQANPDDDETALRVILMRSGTAAERTAADRPFDPDTVRAPRADDFGKPHAVADHGPTKAADESAPSEAPATAKPEPAADPTPDAPPPGPDLRPQTDAAILSDARSESAKFSAGLPSYLALQVTSRYFATGFPSRWQEIDVVTAELAYVGGKEEYRDFRIDGKPIDQPVESTGTWSTGEFGTTLEDVMSPATDAVFHRRGEQKFAGREAIVFDYTVAQEHSHWTMVSPDGRRYKPAYEGAAWIDRATRRVLRIEQRTTAIPRDFTVSRAEATLEYGFAKIDQSTYLLPARGENIGCMSGSGACTRNTIEFRNYRKFTAESTVSFGK